jgi:hypothetical protein
LVLMCEMQNLLSAAKILFVSVKTQLRQWAVFRLTALCFFMWHKSILFAKKLRAYLFRAIPVTFDLQYFPFSSSI